MLKRLFAALILMSILLSVCTAFAATMQQGSMYVNTANGRALRFRSSKSTTPGNVLDEIPYGTKVYVLSWDGTWARIRYNGAVGYVVKKHLTIARPEEYSVVQAERAQEDAEKQRQKELKAANSRLDHSRLRNVVPYDVTVRTGVNELKANVYVKPDLTSTITAAYSEGVRLSVSSENRDWALVYNGANEQSGYMLLEELEPDIMEEVLLDD